MKNDIITLSEKLHKYNPELILNNKNILDLMGIKLFCDNQVFFEPDYIYFARMSELTKLKVAENITNLLCIQDILLPVQSIVGCNTNILILRNNYDFAFIFNLVQDILNADKRVSSHTAILLDAIVYSKGIQYIIETASEILNNPIVLLDIEMNLLAKSQVLETDDVIWNELLNNGGFSQDTLDYITTAKIKEIALSHSYPFLFLDERLQYQRIIGNVVVNGITVGFFVVMESKKKITEDDLELSYYFCNIMSSEMQINKTHLNLKGAAYNTFMSDVLSRKIKDPDLINQRAKNIGLKLKKHLFLLAIKNRLYEKINYNVIEVKNKAEELLSDSKAFIYDDSVLVLITKGNTAFLSDQYFKEFLKYLESKQLIAGLSNSFCYLHELLLNYQLSIKSIELGLLLKHEITLFRYRKYQIYHLLDICSKQVDLNAFCNPIVQDIIEYDKLNSSEFTKTLYAYLIYSKDTIRVANFLHIHRNTVFYRIEKMKELFKLDFNDGNLLQNIFLSLKIMEMNGTLGMETANQEENV